MLANSVQNSCSKQPFENFLKRHSSVLKKLHNTCFTRTFPKISGAASENSRRNYQHFFNATNNAVVNADVKMPMPRFLNYLSIMSVYENNCFLSIYIETITMNNFTVFQIIVVTSVFCFGYLRVKL